jgi:protein-L-isoaspartate(D-aspartate) O-methyltransferase
MKSNGNSAGRSLAGRSALASLTGIVCFMLPLAAHRCSAQTARQYATARAWLVESELATAGVKSPTVLAAMREVPRHEFVPPELRAYAYFDATLPIGQGQTISPPYIVAWMTEQLDPQPQDRVLEIGTGSGYQAAVLSRLVKEVYTIEIHEELAAQARAALKRVGYNNVHARTGDGFLGWPEAAPFDRIMVTCSPEKVPAPLAEQLREGGRMLIPVGEGFNQNLCVMVKQQGKLRVAARTPTYFVPMTGKADSVRSQPRGAAFTPLVNGDFEELLEPGVPAAWYYLRQATLEEGGPLGSLGHFLRFQNQVPGRRCQAIQSFGADGSQVSRLLVEVWSQGTDIQSGNEADPHAGGKLAVTFFGADRAPVGEHVMRLGRGNFDWRRQQAVVPVPPEARVAALTLGLFGATGQMCCDNIVVRPLEPETALKTR